MNETLLGIAQLNVAIAGFAGLVLLLQNASELSVLNRNRFRVMIRSSLSAAIACAIALALFENFSTDQAAVASSVFYLLVIGFNLVSGIWTPGPSLRQDSSLFGRLFFGGMMVFNSLIQLANIFYFQNMEVFVIGPIIAVVMSILLFIRLLGDISRIN